MTRMPIEEESKLILVDDQVEPPSDDAGGDNVGGRTLKRGPWTAAEDKLLEEYVQKHGPGNWNAVRKLSGLSRCGKSCRLRWSNHLRPDLKKGAFTPEEERKIAELHAKMGNKWSRMAEILPGRTDNEIKNYWNTRRKRALRSKTPLYPPGIHLQAASGDDQQSGSIVIYDDYSAHDNQQSECITIHGNYSADQPNEPLHGNDVSAVPFHDFHCSHDAMPYAPRFPDVSVDRILKQYLGPGDWGSASSLVDGVRQLMGSENMIPGYHSGVSSVLPSLEQFPVDPSPKTDQIYGPSYQYNPDSHSQIPACFEGAGFDSHVLASDNFSDSRSFPVSVKLEFPSIQHWDSDDSRRLSQQSTPFQATETPNIFPSTQYLNFNGSQQFSQPSTAFQAIDTRTNLRSMQYSDSNGTRWFSQPATPFQATDAYIGSPLMKVSFQSECVLPIDSGMISSFRNQSAESISNYSDIIPNSMMENSRLGLQETELDGHKDPNCSVASVLNEFTPPVIVNSLAELVPLGHNPENVLPVDEHVQTQNAVGKDLPPNMYFSCHDTSMRRNT